MIGLKTRAAACAAVVAVLGSIGVGAVPAAAAPGKCHSFSTDLRRQHVKPNTTCKDVNLLEVRAKKVKRTLYWGEFKSGNRWKKGSREIWLNNGKVGTKVLMSNVRPGTIYQVRAKNGAIVRVLH